MLKFLLIQDCQEIAEQAYIAAGFKKNQNLKILNVAYNRNALSLRCVIELLKYSSGKVLLDIRGQKLAQVEFSEIIREHPDPLERAFQDVDDMSTCFRFNSFVYCLHFVQDFQKYISHLSTYRIAF